MAARFTIQTALFLVALATALFVPAGTLAWPAAWIFLFELAASSAVFGVWLTRHDPALLRERLAPPFQRGQPLWDRVFVVAVGLLWSVWIVRMGMDAGRARHGDFPLWARAIGALGPAASIYVSYLTMRENSWAVCAVRIQRERGHRIVTTGPYRWVRHPMYAGAILFFVGTPLLLGSWTGLAITPLLIAMLAVRAVLEERALMRGLAGYSEYAARVRYRLIPFVW